MSFAKISVLGNIGQDAEVREVNGRFAINFSIAHNRRWTDSDGVKRENTTWFSCAIWKDSRDKIKIAEYLKAGQIVLVEGMPEVRTYKNKDGITVAALNVNVSEIFFAGSAQKQEHPVDKPAVPVREEAQNFGYEQEAYKKGVTGKKDKVPAGDISVDDLPY